MNRLAFAGTVALILSLGKGMAHEFWISPEAYAIAPGETMQAHLRVGEEFRGASQSYIPRNFLRFEVISGDVTYTVDGRIGDLPALAMADAPDGLAIVVHETTERDLEWSEWERFLRFASHKDLGDVTAMQAARGLDQVNVTEVYSRYAKSLIAVGDGAGADRVVGLRTEIVALSNPYTDDLSDGLAVQVWLDGAPRADVQVELFAQAGDGEDAVITLHRTDAEGIAILPVAAGHSYLADAVVLEAADPDTDGAEWRTLWASLTFAVP